MEQFEQAHDHDHEVRSWLAQFSSSLRLDPAWSAEEVRAHLANLENLSRQAAQIQPSFISDPILAGTFSDAARQLPTLEAELRVRLAKLSPGDPESHVDLDEIRGQLAELEARQEVGAPTLTDERQTLLTTQPNWAAAVSMFIFGCGFGGFSLFHAVLMIGGMRTVFGNLAFFMLLFYAIFFSATAFIFVTAFRQASTERVEVEGMTLTQTLDFLGFTRQKRVTFRAPALVEEVATRGSNNNSAPKFSVVVTDSHGNRMSVGETATKSQRNELRKRLSAYFALAKDLKTLP